MRLLITSGRSWWPLYRLYHRGCRACRGYSEGKLAAGATAGFEADPQAINIARERLKPFGPSALLVNETLQGLRVFA
jgi:hypothetical protein